MLSRLDSEVILTHEYTDIVFYYHVTIMHPGQQSYFRIWYLTYCFVMHLQHPYTHTHNHTPSMQHYLMYMGTYTQTHKHSLTLIITQTHTHTHVGFIGISSCESHMCLCNVHTCTD